MSRPSSTSARSEPTPVVVLGRGERLRVLEGLLGADSRLDLGPAPARERLGAPRGCLVVDGDSLGVGDPERLERHLQRFPGWRLLLVASRPLAATADPSEPPTLVEGPRLRVRSWPLESSDLEWIPAGRSERPGLSATAAARELLWQGGQVPSPRRRADIGALPVLDTTPLPEACSGSSEDTASPEGTGSSRSPEVPAEEAAPRRPLEDIRQLGAELEALEDIATGLQADLEESARSSGVDGSGRPGSPRDLDRLVELTRELSRLVRRPGRHHEASDLGQLAGQYLERRARRGGAGCPVRLEVTAPPPVQVAPALMEEALQQILDLAEACCDGRPATLQLGVGRGVDAQGSESCRVELQFPAGPLLGAAADDPDRKGVRLLGPGGLRRLLPELGSTGLAGSMAQLEQLGGVLGLGPGELAGTLALTIELPAPAG